MNSRPISVVIPAHNEEAVIRRTLTTLLGNAEADEFEVIVVCNGCRDRTADVVRTAPHQIEVIELTEASKTLAINAGLERARGRIVMLLDADVELDTRAARSLAEAAGQPGVEAAIGHMVVDTKGADRLVKAFYQVWLEHPYLRRGKFAAAMAFSRAGLERIDTLPPVTADDTYLRRLFPADRVAVVESVGFIVRVPRTVSALIKVRARSHRGSRELKSWVNAPDQYPAEALGLLGRLLPRPRLWSKVPVYVGVTLAARALSYRNSGTRWERDLTTRTQPAD